MRVKAEGEITIPDDIRRALDIDEDTELEWELRDGEAVLRVVEPGSNGGAVPDREQRARELVERLSGAAELRWSTDELMRLTRGADWNQSQPS